MPVAALCCAVRESQPLPVLHPVVVCGEPWHIKAPLPGVAELALVGLAATVSLSQPRSPTPGACAPVCAAVIPLCMTGTAVENAQYIGTASIMRYTLSNVEQGSTKLWCATGQRAQPAATATVACGQACAERVAEQSGVQPLGAAPIVS